MKTIWNKLKQFKYYKASLVGLLFLSIAAVYFFKIELGALILGIFAILALLAVAAFFIGSYNRFKEGAKAEAIIFFVIGLALAALAIWLIFIKQPEL